LRNLGFERHQASAGKCNDSVGVIVVCVAKRRSREWRVGEKESYLVLADLSV
jgi:hypothetical protein